MEVLGRLAWGDNDDSANFPTRLIVSRLLLKALHFYLPSSTTDAAVYTVIVGTVVDLVVSMTEAPSPIVQDNVAALAASIGYAILASVEHLLTHKLPVSHLFQCFQRLVVELPEVAWRSDICVWSAYFLTSDAVGPHQKRQIMSILQHALKYGKGICSKSPTTPRNVYVEVLILPLSSMLVTDRKDAGQLLQCVNDIMAATKQTPKCYVPPRLAKGSRDSGGNVGDIAIHSAMFLALIGGEPRCKAWLDTLTFDETESKVGPLNERWMLLLLSSLLFDCRPSLRDGAARALDRQTLDKHNKYWSQESTKLIVSALVFLLSQKQEIAGKNEWLATSLYVLAALATSSNDTMKVVLRVIDSMKSAPGLRGVALKLLFAVWVREPRVFPRLEAALMEEIEEESDEYRIVKIATLKALCEKDPEAGVDFIGHVQSCLEDSLVSIASMAIDAIAELCRSDCLDFYTAFKIIALKVRKKKVECAENPLFLEKLCNFYALGIFDMKENEKQARKLLAQLWELAETSKDATVRCAAFQSLNAYPLDAAGLVVVTEADAQASEEEEDEGDSDEEDEAVVNTTLLLNKLATEEDEDTREQIQLLVTRILEHESRRHTASIGRGQMRSYSAMDPSQQQQSVSAVATKELRKRLPTPNYVSTRFHPDEESKPTSLESLTGFLFAFYPTAEDGSTLEAQRKSGKRKDRLVRYALQEVESCQNAMNAVFRRMQDAISWASEGDRKHDLQSLLSFLTLTEGWKAFMGTYVSCLEEYAHLKVPATAEEGTACSFFIEIVTAQMDQLAQASNEGRFVETIAAGALIGQLCGLRRYWHEQPVRSYFIKTLSAQSRTLLQTLEAWNVLRTKKQETAFIVAMLSIQLAAVNVRPLTKSELKAKWLCEVMALLATPAEKVMGLLSSGKTEPNELQNCSLLLLSQIGCIYLSTGNIDEAKIILNQLLATALQSLGIGVSSSALQSIFARKKPNTDEILRAIETATSINDNPPLSVSWSAFLSLGQMSSYFGSSKQLGWLQHIQSVLLALWTRGGKVASMNIAGVGLAPILLENIRFGLTSSTMIDQFISSCEARLKTAASLPHLDSGTASVFVVVPFLLSRVSQFIGYDAVQVHLRTFLEHTRSVMAQSNDASTQYVVVAGLANTFSYTFGVKIAESSDPMLKCEFKAGESRSTKEMPFETDSVSQIVQLVEGATSSNVFARFAVGAIARQSDLFHVVQKKLSLDVEMRALPASSLLSRALELLLNASMPLTSSETTELSEDEKRQQINALLSCLAKTGSTLPQFDFAPLITRLMARMRCIEASTLCIRLASTQGSCDALLVRELAMGSTFAVSPLAVQSEILLSLVRTAERIPVSVTVNALDWTTDSVLSLWANSATEGSAYQQVVNAWIALLSALVSPISSRVSSKASETLEAVQAAVSEKILADYLGRLPIIFQDKPLVHKFATTVLVHLNARERLADLLLSSTHSDVIHNSEAQKKQAWWRHGILFSEYAKGANSEETATVARRELAMLVQWLLRHDYEEWDELSHLPLTELMASLIQLIAASTKSLDESVVSSLLDVIDGYARSRSKTSSTQLKCTVLFELTAGVCSLSWRDCLPFEQYLLTSTADNCEACYHHGSPALLLMPTALAHRVASNRRWLPLYEQLWNAFSQWISSRPPHKELEEHDLAVEICFLRVSGASPVNLLPSVKASIDQWWSCSKL